jgi:hypothetical protein
LLSSDWSFSTKVPLSVTNLSDFVCFLFFANSRFRIEASACKKGASAFARGPVVCSIPGTARAIRDRSVCAIERSQFEMSVGPRLLRSTAGSPLRVVQVIPRRAQIMFRKGYYAQRRSSNKTVCAAAVSDVKQMLKLIAIAPSTAARAPHI